MCDWLNFDIVLSFHYYILHRIWQFWIVDKEDLFWWCNLGIWENPSPFHDISKTHTNQMAQIIVVWSYISHDQLKNFLACDSGDHILFFVSLTVHLAFGAEQKMFSDLTWLCRHFMTRLQDATNTVKESFQRDICSRHNPGLSIRLQDKMLQSRQGSWMWLFWSTMHQKNLWRAITYFHWSQRCTWYSVGSAKKKVFFWQTATGCEDTF